MNVLLVDDNPIALDGVASYLRSIGNEVKKAIDGSQAMAEVRGGFQPDVVVLDLMLPGMGAKSFLNELQGSDPSVVSPTPIILATAAADADIAGMHRRVWKIMKKPYELESLRLALIEARELSSVAWGK